jgi:hypothetical protein
MNHTLDMMRTCLPSNYEEIKEAFAFMIDQGVIMSFGILLNKLSNDIFNPLMVAI